MATNDVQEDFGGCGLFGGRRWLGAAGLESDAGRSVPSGGIRLPSEEAPPGG